MRTDQTRSIPENLSFACVASAYASSIFIFMAEKKKRGPKVVTKEHKAAMAAGRAESRAVSNYLEAMAANKPRRGRKRPAPNRGLAWDNGRVYDGITDSLSAGRMDRPDTLG